MVELRSFAVGKDVEGDCSTEQVGGGVGIVVGRARAEEVHVLWIGLEKTVRHFPRFGGVGIR